MRKNKSARNRLVTVAVILMAVSFFTGSCSGKNSASKQSVIDIGERMFATRVNDIYLNAKDYLGKTIKIEGLFKCEQNSFMNKEYCFVIRYGPGGCCGADANVGFEVAWPKGKSEAYPPPDSWVEATGVLKYYKEDDDARQYLYLDLSSLDVLPWHGNETVWQ